MFVLKSNYCCNKQPTLFNERMMNVAMNAGIILGMGSPNERQCYNLTSSHWLSAWLNDPTNVMSKHLGHMSICISVILSVPFVKCQNQLDHNDPYLYLKDKLVCAPCCIFFWPILCRSDFRCVQCSLVYFLLSGYLNIECYVFRNVNIICMLWLHHIAFNIDFLVDFCVLLTLQIAWLCINFTGPVPVKMIMNVRSLLLCWGVPTSNY